MNGDAMQTQPTRYDNLAALMKDAVVLSAGNTSIVVAGQVMHMRRISRKCSFWDLESVDQQEQGEKTRTPQRIEVVLKIIDDELSMEQVESMRRRVHLGDIVDISGFLESMDAANESKTKQVGTTEHMRLLLHARDICVVNAWQDRFPEQAFVPAPSTLNFQTPKDHNDEPPKKKLRPTQEHCKFWINTGTCQRGDACTFRHVAEDERAEARVAWLQQRLHLKREFAKHEDDPIDPQSRVSKVQRAEIFVDWLVSTFGDAMLRSGSGVVDVAGGRGNVSFELWNKRKIPCTLIDPRPMKLSRIQYKFFAKERVPKADIPAQLVLQKLTWFDGSTFLQDNDNRALIENASILIGMHPDEATDSIVDVALKFNKPFAIMPCCVFSDKFPLRRIDGDRKVLSFEDYEQYLLAKHQDICKTFLPFNGKNLVLYRTQSEEDKLQDST